MLRRTLTSCSTSSRSNSRQRPSSGLGDQDSAKIFSDLQSWVAGKTAAPIDLREIVEDPKAGLEVCQAIRDWALDNSDAQFVYILAHGNTGGLADTKRGTLTWKDLSATICAACKSIPRDPDDVLPGPSRLSLILLSCKGSYVTDHLNANYRGQMPVSDVVGFRDNLPFRVVRPIIEQAHAELATLNLNFRKAFVKTLYKHAPERQPELYTLDPSDSLLELVENSVGKAP